MPETRRLYRDMALPLALGIGLGLLTALGPASRALRADTVVLKNGIVYRGTIDRDRPLLWVYDGLKRVVLRDSKVDKINSDASFRGLETFRVEQPLVVHGGSMPKEVLSVEAGPWNDRGRREFKFEGSRIGKFVRMEQAINELGPHMVRIRGVDGYWQGQLETNQIPRDVILAILAKVDRKDQNERVRVARFLIQAEWYPEARAELDQIVRDFPGDADLKERVAAARASVVALEASQTKATIDRDRALGQPRKAATLVKTFPTKDVAPELIAQVRELERNLATQEATDKGTADDLRALSNKLPADQKKSWAGPMLEVLAALRDAPDAVRDRFVAWQKARTADPKRPEGEQLALAMSGYVLGSDAAVADLEAAAKLWTSRDLVRHYLGTNEPSARDALLLKINETLVADEPGQDDLVKALETLTHLAQKMAPPLHEDPPANSSGSRIHRVRNDANVEPTDYMVSLPPEYHPLRSYPAVVALHDGTGPQAAIAWWSAEAARHGYIVVAPEYRRQGQGKEYHYTETEHAAVELSLRDARRRYAIDSDRVFLGGQLVGGNMAWDFGLAHPDLFAGVVIVSGMPFKYANRYLGHAERTPLYVALGDLAPAGNEVVFGQMLKPLIARGWDITYLEYLKRGLEELPEEAPAALDWADRRRRDPFPKAFEAVTARECDNRFNGVVIREFQPGRMTAPEGVDGFGKNLNPATFKVKSSAASNLLNITSTGLKRFDVWLSPKIIDLGRKLEVRVNNKPFYKGMAKPTLGPLLEDLRLRGDRQQIYWMKVPVG
jgi:predicted esterase